MDGTVVWGSSREKTNLEVRGIPSRNVEHLLSCASILKSEENLNWALLILGVSTANRDKLVANTIAEDSEENASGSGVCLAAGDGHGMIIHVGVAIDDGGMVRDGVEASVGKGLVTVINLGWVSVVEISAIVSSV